MYGKLDKTRLRTMALHRGKQRITFKPFLKFERIILPP
jgi:hypothetical protein